MKEAEYNDEDKAHIDDSKGTKSEETERKIINKGSSLLKRLIPLESFQRQIDALKKVAGGYLPETNRVEDTLKLEDNLKYINIML